MKLAKTARHGGKSMKNDFWPTKTTIIPALLTAFFAAIVLNSAWICDDAYISLRTVDNFVNGHGLRWNVAERVQTFTNPLWTLMLSAVYFFTREAYYSTIILALLVAVAGAGVLFFKTGRKNIVAAVLGALFLFSSKAFVDFSTSGLENPLLHLFIILFFLQFLTGQNDNRKLFRLSLITALAVTTRMDAILLFAPALLWQVFSNPGKSSRQRRMVSMLAGFIPFILWETFALIYYGFLFPNTAYAKLNSGIATNELIVQGLHYFLDSLARDPLTLLAILICGIAVFMRREKRALAAFSGVLLYLFYVLSIGGDFMSGRFLAAPFCAAVVILVMQISSALTLKKAPPTFVTILLIGLLNPVSPLRAGRDFQNRTISEKGIADERGWYYQGTGLLVSDEIKKRPINNQYLFENRGKKYREEWREQPVRVVGNAGFIGFFSGPKVYLIDHLGLGDPFLSRLKPDLNSGWRFGLPSKTGWRIGHYFRHLPEGYVQTKAFGRNMIVDRELADDYERLTLITCGDVFRWRRFVEILKLNIDLVFGD